MKRIVSLLIILACLISIANAQTFSVGVQVEQIGLGAEAGGTLFGAVGDITFGNISIRPSVQFGSVAGPQMPLNITLLDVFLLYNFPLIGSPLTPYVGSGIGLFMMSWGGYSASLLTLSGVLGVKYKLSEQFDIFAHIRSMLLRVEDVAGVILGICVGAMYGF